MPLSELNKVTRQAGNNAARDHAANHASTPDRLVKLDQVTLLQMEWSRRISIREIRKVFNETIEFDLLPREAQFRQFRMGWRGGTVFTHGTPAGYSQGCRGPHGCVACKEAWRVYQKQRRDNKKAEQSSGERAAIAASSKAALERQQAAEFALACERWVRSFDGVTPDDPEYWLSGGR